ncbi:hypothetical protein TNCV_4740071 [Trichonephila clavipes]|nr:hypothetical protein TNCV_4740071 [Trichonephila clavipes]
MELPVYCVVGGSRRCLTAVLRDASLKGKAPFEIVLTSTMENFTYAENADMHYMYDHANSKGKAALRMYYVQLSDRRMPV